MINWLFLQLYHSQYWRQKMKYENIHREHFVTSNSVGVDFGEAL